MYLCCRLRSGKSKKRFEAKVLCYLIVRWRDFRRVKANQFYLTQRCAGEDQNSWVGSTPGGDWVGTETSRRQLTATSDQYHG